VFFAKADARVAMYAKFFVEQNGALLVSSKRVGGTNYNAVAALVAQYCIASPIFQR
jgi:hypothetical protein